MRLPPWLTPDPIHVLGLVLVAAGVTRAYRLRTPDAALIFDEQYYVNAARIILGLDVPAGAPYAGQPSGLDPNLEHPPLAKLLIAGSMWLFGDDGFGWRFPSLLAGMACIVLVYGIVRAVSDDAWLAVLTASIFALDNLVLVHSRIATLDILFVALVLLGAWYWLRGWHLAAGIACGVAALVKLPAVLGLAALALLGVGACIRSVLRDRALDRRAARGTILLLLGFVTVWLGGLWLLDLAFTDYTTPWSHVRFMLDYGFSITGGGASAAPDSEPWQWLANEVQMPYFRVDDSIYFRGAMNPVVLAAALVAVPYVAWRAWRFREPLSLWVVAWVATTYVFFYPLVLLTHRTTYLFYVLPTLAAFAVAIALLLREPRLPRAVTWACLLAVAVGFYVYYPFQHVLSVW